MFQYEKDVFSVIHPVHTTPEIGDSARVYHKTSLHKPNRSSQDLNIIEVLETRKHRTDVNNMISIVRCSEQV